MSKTPDSYDSAALEALIRAAGHHVQPSEGLRPQVMDAVRGAKGDRRHGRQIAKGAIFASAAALALSAIPLRTPSSELRGPTTMEAVLANLGGESTPRGSDLGWRIVELFADVRQQQAESLRSRSAAEAKALDERPESP